MTATAVAAPSHRAIAIAFAVWTVLLALFLWREYAALRSGATYATFSYYVRAIRFTAPGRFVLLPAACWLMMHLFFAPRWLGVNPSNWRTWLALAIGLAWAACEQFGWLGMRP